MITIGWFASTARNLVLARASPAAGTPPKAGSSTPLDAPRAGCALSPFPIFTRSCSLTDGWPPGVGGGRFPAFPSRGQQNRPCACAASIRALGRDLVVDLLEIPLTQAGSDEVD